MDETFIPIIDSWMRKGYNSSNSEGMQVFVSDIRYDYLSAFEEHITMLRRAFIHSMFRKGNTPDDRSFTCMEGFIEHYHRIPNEHDNDKCGVIYFNNTWFRIFDGIEQSRRIVSECRLAFN